MNSLTTTYVYTNKAGVCTNKACVFTTKGLSRRKSRDERHFTRTRWQNFLRTVFIPPTGIIMKLLPVLVLLFASCSDEPEQKPQNEIGNIGRFYDSLLETFYNRTALHQDGEDVRPGEYVPAYGAVLDEAKPSERSLCCETFELAEKNFKKFLPASDSADRFISYSDDKIAVSLNDFGSVVFSRCNDGQSVAKVEIVLKDAKPYTMLYRPKAAFPGNSHFDGLLYECCTVYFDCPICNEYIGGLIMEAEDWGCTVFSRHVHSYLEKDDFKSVRFYWGLTTFDDWMLIKSFWQSRYYTLMKMSDQKIAEAEAIVGTMHQMPPKYDYIYLNNTELFKSYDMAPDGGAWTSDVEVLDVYEMKTNNYMTLTLPYAMEESVESFNALIAAVYFIGSYDYDDRIYSYVEP